MDGEKLTIWHISDAHCLERHIKFPNEEIDLVIFSGDCSNSRDKFSTEREILNFLEWFKDVPAKHKIFVAGNHDLAIERNLITKELIESYGVIYLFNSDVTIEGLKIWGSPYTPTFGVGWAYNMSRTTINRLWETIPDDVDVIISHGPPKGVLDLSFDLSGNLEFCGCSALEKRINQIKPKLVCFGHIHNSKWIKYNSSVIIKDQIIYSNGSCATDGKFEDVNYLNHGNIIKI